MCSEIDDFEWDRRKAEINVRLHGVTFRAASRVFADEHRLDKLDDREDYGEERWLAIGFVADKLIVVAYTMRGHGRTARIISARFAERREVDEYYQGL